MRTTTPFKSMQRASFRAKRTGSVECCALTPFKSMQRIPLFSLLAASLLILPLLSACGNALSSATTQPGASTQTAPASLQQVDWNNFTYIFTCYTDQPAIVKVTNGSAHPGYVYYTVSKPVFGDLTGDGQPEAVIPFQCSAADTAPAQVFVYTGTAQHPRQLATLPLGGTQPMLSVRSATIANGTLLLSGDGYTPHDPLCCPSLHTTITYQWNGTNFAVIATHSSLIATPTP